MKPRSLPPLRRFVPVVLAALLAAAVLFGGLVWYLNLRDESPPSTSSPSPAGSPTAGSPGAAASPASAQVSTQTQIERGAYLARAGNCAGCHTARGGAPMAGGVGIETPFGIVYAGNLTPDPATGIGDWSADDFWRALHNGRSKDGRLLYPAFPYPNYTRVTREDADAIHAFLRSLPPAVQKNRPHALRFPYDTQAALAVWRALFFTPGVQRDDPRWPVEWNRGAYLVRGLGHCEACHAGRNLLGATRGELELGGGVIPLRNWYAPSLASPREAGVADWPVDDVVALLKTGVSPRGSVSGPMAEVVFASTQHLSEPDLRAMAVFLKALPRADADAAGAASAPGGDGRGAGRGGAAGTGIDAAVLVRGEQVYARHCAHCHGDRGEGAPGAYPPLAGNRAVTLDPPANLVRIILEGGFLPATAGNPRPYGMPPFGQLLDDAEVAAAATYLRAAWGNGASPVSLQDVLRWR